MAQLAMAIGGAAAGGKAFGGKGAQIGFLAGSLLGAWLFAPKTTAEGPRLDDLRVTTSTYGQPIPIGYGTVRTPGNCIWSTDIKETRNKKKVGGKGGPSATQISYTYTCSFAVALAHREASHVLRIWADSKLIYDVTAEAGDINTEANKGILFRSYLGTETQEPDSLIEAEKGIGNTPAYKGVVYIVFEDLELSDYGNRIPSITADIAFNGTTAHLATDVTPSNANYYYPNGDCWAKDKARPYLWAANHHQLVKYNIITGAEIASCDLPDLLLASRIVLGADGSLFAQLGNTNAAPFYKFDSESLSIVGGIGPSSSAVNYSRYISNLSHSASVYLPQLNADYPDMLAVLTHFGNRITFLSQNRIVDLTLTLSSAQVAMVSNPLGVPELGYEGDILFSEIGGWTGNHGNALCIDKNGTLWVATGGKGLIKIVINSRGAVLDYGYVDKSTIYYTAEFFDLSAELIYAFNYICYSADDDSLIIGASSTQLSSNRTSLLKFDISSETVTERYISPDNLIGVAGGAGYGNFQYGIQNGKLFLSNSGTSVIFNPATFEVEEIYDENDWGIKHRSGYFFDEPSQSVYRAINALPINLASREWLDRAAGAPELLSSVVDDLSDRSGLDSALLDVSALTGETVRGYLISQQTSGRSAIAPLSSAFFFDAVESDWVLKFVMAGGASVFTINAADLAAHHSGSRPPDLTEVINQEIELPRQVYVKYQDADNDSEPGEAVYARRANLLQSKRRQELSYPILLTGSEAKQIAAAWMYRLWVSQNAYKCNVSQKWLLLDPTDVGSIIYDGITFPVTLNNTKLGSFVIDIDAAQEDSIAYNQTIEGDSGRDQDAGEVPRVSITTPLLFDVPLLRDMDADALNASIRVYGGVISYSTDWRGASYFKSKDGASFLDVLFFGAAENVEYGHLTTDLTASNWGTWDRFRYFSVKMANGSPESATELAVLNGANAALVGNDADGFELIQFATVTDQTGGIYKIENLLRGRRGTNNEQAHNIGALFILLTEETIKRFDLDLDALNATRYIAASTIGAVIDNTQSLSRTVTAKSLKPWSPANVLATWDDPATDDISVTWERRTRYGGTWLNGIGTVPLNEAAEEYSIDVLNASGVVVRTVIDLTSEAWTYTDAQQTIDFGSPQTEININLYQISAIAGRGFVADVTLREG